MSHSLSPDICVTPLQELARFHATNQTVFRTALGTALMDVLGDFIRLRQAFLALDWVAFEATVGRLLRASLGTF